MKKLYILFSICGVFASSLPISAEAAQKRHKAMHATGSANQEESRARHSGGNMAAARAMKNNNRRSDKAIDVGNRPVTVNML